MGSLFAKKGLIILLTVLIGLSFGGMVAGGIYLYTSSVAPQHQEETVSYDIRMDEYVEVFADRTFRLSPTLIDENGDEVSGKFIYEYDNDRISIDRYGYVTVLDEQGGEVSIKIKERTTGVEKNIRLYIVAELDGVLEVRLDGKCASDGTELYIDSEYVFEVITLPSATDVSRYLKLTAVDENGTEKNVFDLSVRGNKIHLVPTGLGSGTLYFELENPDRNLKFRQSITFSISLPDATLTESVLSASEQTLLERTDVQAVERLVFAEEVTALSFEGIGVLTGLKTIVFQATELVNAECLSKIPQTTAFRVNGLDLYETYVASNDWAERKNLIYPYLEKTDGMSVEPWEIPVVVYHNQGSYRLLDTMSDGLLPLLEMGDGIKIYTPSTVTDYTYVSSNSPRLLANAIIGEYALLEYSFDGYRFAGWVDANGTAFDNSNLAALTEGIHVYAQWTPNSYTLTLEDYIEGANELSVTYDQKIGSLPTPSKNGWRFVGWYLSDQYLESERVTEDVVYRLTTGITLYAKYETEVTLHYHNVVDNVTLYNVVYGKPLGEKLSEAGQGGWNFAGWYSSTSYAENAKIERDAPFVLEGTAGETSLSLFAMLTHDITLEDYQNEIGTETAEQITVVCNKTLSESLTLTGGTLPIGSEKGGWKLIGWTLQPYTNSGFEVAVLDQDLIVNDANILTVQTRTLYAIYESTVAIKGGTHGETPIDTRTIIFGCRFTVGSYSDQVAVPGYTFADWYLNAQSPALLDGLQITANYANATIYAMYTANRYSITFMDGETQTAQLYFYDIAAGGDDHILNNELGSDLNGRRIIVPSVPRHVGYSGQWYYNGAPIEISTENGESIWYVPTDVFEDITLTAQYTANKYTVHFDDLGTGSQISDITVTFDSVYGTLPTPICPEGYQFAGWYADADYSMQVQENTTYDVEGDITLYAKYVIEVVFVDYYGLETTAHYVYGKRAEFNLLPNIDGWRFDGWYDESDNKLVYDYWNLNGNVEIKDYRNSAKKYISRWTRQITLQAGDGFALPEGSEVLTVIRGRTLSGIGLSLPTNTDLTKTGDAAAWTLKRWYYIGENGEKITASADDLNLVDTVSISTLYAEYTCSVNIIISLPSGAMNMTIPKIITLGGTLFKELDETYQSYFDAEQGRGYHHVGWQIGDIEYRFSESDVYSDDLILAAFGSAGKITAIFEGNRYSVSYDANGGDITPESIETTYDAEFVLPNKIERTGYRFVGWKFGNTVYAAGQVVSKLAVSGEITLVAQWEIIHYTVSFTDYTGKVVAERTYTVENRVFETPEIPARTGYVVVWEDFASVLEGAAENFEVKAQYTPIQYSITYNTNGGEGTVDSQNVFYDNAENLMLADAISRLGYTFIGWKYNDTVYEAGVQIPNLTAEAGAEVELVAQWTVKKYELIYTLDGKEVARSTYHVEMNSYLQPDIPLKYGFQSYWDFEVLKTLDHETTAFEIKACYVAIPYQIRFVANGKLFATTTYTIETIDKVVLPYDAPSNLGYTFIKWESFDLAILGDKTVNAVFEPTQYTLVFQNGEGEEIDSKFYTVEDNSIVTPAIPERSGYVGHWMIANKQLSSEVLFDFIKKLEQGNTTVVIKAAYTPHVYNVTLEGAKQTHHYSYTKEQLVDDKLTLLLPALQEGYTYVSNLPIVSYDANTNKITLTVAQLSDITIREIPTETTFFTVTFDYGYDNTQQTVLYLEGETVELPTPLRKGYQFQGWYLGEELMGGETKIDSTVTLTAKWTEIQYTVAFEGYDESDATLSYEQPLELITPSPKDGYRFLGWYLEEVRYTNGMKNLTAIDGETITLTPVWEPIRYTILYDTDGGEETPPSHTVLYGSSFHFPLAPVKKGYIFLGWNLNDVRYAAGQQLNNFAVTGSEHVTIRADWQAISYTVVFANSSIEAATWIYDQPNDLPLAVKDDHQFAGWEYLGKTYNSGYTMKNLSATDGDTVVLTACWEPNVYSIHFKYYHLGSEKMHNVGFTQTDLFVNEPLPNATAGYAVGWESYVPAGDLTVSEVRIQNGKTLTYHLGEKRAYRVFATADELEELQAKAPALPQKDGYVASWDYVEDENGNYNAYPKYVLENSEMYQLTLDPNGGVMKNPAFVFVSDMAYGVDCLLPASDEISRTGYRFGGWSLNDEVLASDTFCYVIDENVSPKITLKAVWEPIEYTIIFRGVEDVKVVYTLDMQPSEIQLPGIDKIAQRNGYVGSWQLPVLSGTDMIVYPTYTPVIFNISFDLGEGGGAPEPLALPYGSEFYPQSVLRDGYRLVGWELNGTTYRIDELISCYFDVANGVNITLKAVWEKAISVQTYTATFVSMDQVVDYVLFTQSDIERGYLLAPTLPTREHFVGTWEAYTLSASDLTIHAVWSPVVYELRFLSDTDPAEVLDRIYVTAENEAIVMPVLPQKEGYTASWVKDPEDAYAYRLTYTPFSYTIEFTSEDDAKIESQKVSYDAETTLPAALVRPGYIFGGWKLGETTYAAEAVVQNLTATDGDVLTMSAVWKPEAYTLTLMDGENELGTVSFTVQYTLDQIRELCAVYPITVPAGYENPRWNISDKFVYQSQTVTPEFDLITYRIYFVDSNEKLLGSAEWRLGEGAVEEPVGKFIYTLEPASFDVNNELYVVRQEVQMNEQTVKFYQQIGNETPVQIATRYFDEVNRTFFIPVVPSRSGYLGEWDMENIHVTINGEEMENPKDYLEISALGDSVTVSEAIFEQIGDKKMEIRIHAVYTPITYTILYDSQGGTPIDSTEITYDLAGQIIGAAPERLGYTFGGWYCSVTDRTYGASSELEDVNAIAKVQGVQVVFLAVWNPIQYIVEYQMNDGSTINISYPATYDELFALSSAPERPNYTFVEWDINGERYPAGYELINLCSTVGEKVLVEAIWLAKSYTITFVGSDGKTVGECTYTEQTKEDIMPPEPPQKQGYVAAWEDYSDLLADGILLSDFEVSVCYTPISYRVIYDANGGSSTPDAVEANYETVWNLAAAVTKKGYDFVGWRMGDQLFEAGAEVSALVTEPGDCNLIAEWKPTTYQVVFMTKEEDAQDNEVFAIRTYTVETPDFDLPPLPAGYLAWAMPEAITPDAVIYPVAATQDCIITFVNERGEFVASLVATLGEPLNVTLPAVPEKRGYQGSWVIPETIEGNLTVSPEYELVTYRAYFYDEKGNLVTFVDENGNECEYSTYTVKDGKLKTPAVPQKEHYNGAWNIPDELVGDLKITALYTPIVYKITYLVDSEPLFERYYSIEYVLNGWTISDPVLPEKVGKVSVGWRTSELGKYDLRLLTDQTVEARYTSSMYTVVYDSNGATSTPVSHHLEYEQTFRINDSLGRPGYVLSGWMGSNGVLYAVGQEVSKLTDVHNAIIVLTAQWEEILYNVHFDTNGGSAVNDKNNISYNESFNLPGGPSKKGYDFTGWVWNNTHYLPGDTLVRLTTVPGTVNIVADFTAVKYAIHYDFNGGTQNGGYYPNDYTVEDYISLPTPTRNGYNFNGWYCTSLGYTIDSINRGTTGDIQLVAQWTQIPTGSGPCVATGTLVTLADGTTKRVEELQGDEILLVWDFVTGTYVERPIVFLYCHGDDVYKVINLEFSDGTTIQIIGEHGFYDPDLKRFVLISDENYQEYIGHRFAKMNTENTENGSYSFVTLVDASVEIKYTGSYSVWTAQNVNFITNDMLSLTPLEFSFFENCFEYGDNMMFDQEQMQADIEKYGVYTYEEWSAYMTYEQFLAFNGPYIKVAVGKGLTTEQELITLIGEYLPKEGESNIRS